MWIRDRLSEIPDKIDGSIKRSSRFIRNNPVTVPLLTTTVGLSLFVPIFEPRWFNWEFYAFCSTVVYSFYLYFVEGLIRRKRFMRDSHRQGKIFLTIVCFLILAGTAFFSLLHHLKVTVIDYTHPNITKMFLLFVSALFFAIAANALGKGGEDSEKNVIEDEISRSFKTSFAYSEAPMCVGFLLFAVYAAWLGEQYINDNHMEGFFAGAIALQMMVSNIIWVFADNALVEN